MLPRLRSDLLDAPARAHASPAASRAPRSSGTPRAAVTVVLASRGYPESSSTGDVIAGLDGVPAGVEVIHAGTASADGAIVTAGGRVLNVTALGDDVARRPGGRVCCRRHDRRSTAASCGGTSRGMSERQPAETAASPRPRREFAELEVDAPRVGHHHGLQVRHGQRWRRPARCSRSTASATRSASCPPTAIPTWSPTTAKNAQMRGLRVIIAGAGLSAALPGVVAAHTRPAGDRRAADVLARRSRAASTRSSRSCRCRRASRSRASAWTTRATPRVLAARILDA